MARKTSDIALLLGSRGRSRSKGGFGYVVRSLVDAVLGRGQGGRSLRRDDRRSRGVSGWLFVGGVLLAFAGGFLLGGHLGGPNDAGPAGLRAGVTGRTPAFVGEVDALPMAPQAFVVSAYPGLVEDDARARAAALARYLQAQGLPKSRPYCYPARDGAVWVVAVYFDGEVEQAATRDRLRALPADVPDETFVMLRNRDEHWPQWRDIR